MSKVIVYLPETEFGALQRLAQREYRATRAQAAVVIREELQRLGLVHTDAGCGPGPLQGMAGGGQ